MKREAFFAGGCFWGVEEAFSKVKGVTDTDVGYMNGNEEDFPNPTYEQVCSGLTGYAETVKITYDEEIIDYLDLVSLFFEIHDPTQKNRQGPDIGDQYRSAVFYKEDSEKKIVEKKIKELKKEMNVETVVEKAGTFFRAEEYHQEYNKKHNSSCNIN